MLRGSSGGLPCGTCMHSPSAVLPCAGASSDFVASSDVYNITGIWRLTAAPSSPSPPLPPPVWTLRCYSRNAKMTLLQPFSPHASAGREFFLLASRVIGGLQCRQGFDVAMHFTHCILLEPVHHWPKVRISRACVRTLSLQRSKCRAPRIYGKSPL